MRRCPAKLCEGVFDVLVIGGGIVGAGIARDAALRGLRVALIDQSDFASGTSSRSSKLIHGGLRYLEQWNFPLVAESCRERQRLLELAPHLVHSCEFLFPVYHGARRPLWQVRLGLSLYDRIARRAPAMRHQTLSVAEVINREPALRQEGLYGAVVYSDCREDDARFCIETILHAADLGATCVNYCEFTGMTGDVAQVRDRLTGLTFEVRARWYVNAAGPWVEQVARMAGQDPRPVALSPTKGIHLILPTLTRNRAITFQGQVDGRIMFVIPWEEYSLVGTTDTDWTGDASEAYATPADVAYLLHEIQTLFPSRQISQSDIVTTFAGVRALLRSGKSASSRNREHRIIRHRANFLSVAGGKYTTFRLIAEQVVNQITTAPCRTATTPWPVRPAGEDQFVTSVSDYMRRRTNLALSRQGDAPMAATVSHTLAKTLGWTEAQRQESVAEYMNEWQRNHP